MRRSLLSGAALAVLVLASCAAATNIIYNEPLPTLPAGAPRYPAGFPGVLFGVPYNPPPIPANGYRGLYVSGSDTGTAQPPRWARADVRAVAQRVAAVPWPHACTET